MYCTDCGKEIEKDSSFCKYCGTQIFKAPALNARTIEELTVWEILAELLNQESAVRKKYVDLVSQGAWELASRIPRVFLEKMIDEKRKELNILPYKTIEYLESVYITSFLAGYWCWIAEAISLGKAPKSKSSSSADELFEEWKKVEDIQYSEAVVDALVRYLAYKFDSVLENAPEIKNLSNEVVEHLKAQILLMIRFGYSFAGVESSHR